MTELICISCPKGCHLKVDEANGFAVTGNACPRGEVYGKNELQHPVRVVTSTVRLTGAAAARLPVKTDKPLPKEKMFACMDALTRVTAAAPVAVGQVLVPNVCGTGVNIVSTKTVHAG